MRVVTLLALLGVASATVLESLHDIPDGWKQIGLPAQQRSMHVRIAMKSVEPDRFEQKLYDTSNPSSPNYAQYLKRDELREMMRPSPKATAAVLDWLIRSGVNASSIADEGEWIHIVAPVEVLDDMLDTSFGLFRNDQGQFRVRTLQYSVPDDLEQYVHMIQPTTRFGEFQEQRSQVYIPDTEQQGTPQRYAPKVASKNVENSCNGRTVTPDCLRALYNIPDDPEIDNATSGFMAFTNYLEQYPRDDDLAEFTQDYFPRANGVTYSYETVNDAPAQADVQNSPEDSGEANLDIQYLLATGWPVNIHTYSIAGRGYLIPDLDQPTQDDNDNEPFVDWLSHMLAQEDEDLPHTVATSYGENEQSVPERYRLKVCEMIGQLGARGVSVLFASGDTGVGSACQTNDGKNTTRFLPIFPASCPYVTSVGSTRGINPERAIHFSSGGFSDTWKRPSYQDKAVTSYLKRLGSQWNGLYNPTGRGIPDVSAQGYHFHVVDKGVDTLISGTSASAPVFAGIIALLNAQRLKAGKKPLGFLNPWIYSAGFEGLNDVVEGGSTGCTGVNIYSNLPTPVVVNAAWNASKGWDPVTGYGTPDYERLLPLALAA